MKSNKVDQQVRALHKSFLYAFQGLRFCLKNERNMRIHLAMAVNVTAFSLVYGLEAREYALLFLILGMVLACEAFNTAIEALVNLASSSYHQLAKVAKDVSAGAVLIAAISAACTGVCLFGDWPRLLATGQAILASPWRTGLAAFLVLGGIWFAFWGGSVFRD